MPESFEEYASKSDFDRLKAMIEELTERIGADDNSSDFATESGETVRPDKVVEQVTRQVTAYVNAHPIRAAVIAFILGLLIAGRGRR